MTKVINLIRSKKVLDWSNNTLSLIILVISLNLILVPLLPEAELRFIKATNSNSLYVYQSELSTEKGIEQTLLKARPNVNTILIPSIGVDAQIHKGADASTLNQGVWIKPNGSTPDQIGNTIMVAHRYINGDTKNSFYFLPNLEVGEMFTVFWEEKEFIYKVTDKKEVKDWQIEIENQTQEQIITLYTCTPFWTSENRLVVTGKLLRQA